MTEGQAFSHLNNAVSVDMRKLQAFCERRGIRELALFGSALRADFRPDSDIDVLVSFRAGITPTLDDYTDMVNELSELFGRRVDLVYRRIIERDSNYLLRRSILNSARVIYAA